MKHPVSVSLSIPKPCAERWGRMIPLESGAFCNACSSTVADFTGWSDAALAAYMTDSTHQGCGRFLQSQLHRALIIPHQPHSRLYRWVMAAGFAAITLSSVQAEAQSAGNPPAKHLLHADSSRTGRADGPLTLHGIVTDSSKRPVAKARVQILAENRVLQEVYSDAKGHYGFEAINPVVFRSPSIRLEIQREGYRRFATNLHGIRTGAILPVSLMPSSIDKPLNIDNRVVMGLFVATPQQESKSQPGAIQRVPPHTQRLEAKKRR